MIARVGRYLSGRVSRRLFLLFVLSAFVPLAALAALSFLQTRDMLLQQGEQRLAATAKSFGMALFERLLLLSDLAAASVAPHAPAPAAGSLARHSFRSLARLQPDGSVVTIFGEPRPQLVGDDARQRLGEGRSVLLLAPAREGFDLLLAVPATVGGEGVALAELVPETFWQPEMLPAATDFCVIDEDTRAVLFCSSPMPESTLRTAATPLASQAASRVLRWTRDSETYLGVSWSQFMRPAFGTADWVIVASQPETFLLARLIDFQRVYVPVVILALLLVSWLTIRHSRTIVAPVARLAERARAISRNDFSGRVEMDRHDEFGELATAFNQMSSKLGRQFAALTALSEIDRSSSPRWTRCRWCARWSSVWARCVPADFIGVTLFDTENPDHAHTYFRDMRG